jgi:hypothetical protein
MYFVNGVLRARMVGTVSKEAVLSKLQSVIHGGESTLSTAGTGKEDQSKGSG